MSNPNPDEVVEAVASEVRVMLAEYSLTVAGLDDQSRIEKWREIYAGAISRLLKERSALPPPTSAALSGGRWRPDREEIARIVDPETWARSDADERPDVITATALSYDYESSLAKADAILALSPAQPPNAPSIGDGEHGEIS